MSRSKAAARKVVYEAKVAGLSNVDLLTEALSNACNTGSDQAQSVDFESDGITQTELTRRLQAIGFLPSMSLSKMGPPCVYCLIARGLTPIDEVKCSLRLPVDPAAGT